MKSYKPSHLQKKIKVKKKALKRKRFLKSRVFFDIMLGVIFLLALAYLIFFSRILKINNIQIVSPQEIPKERISQITNNQIGKSYFLVDAQKISQAITNEFPQASKVEVKKGLPGNIFIEIKPRIAQAVWCFGVEGACFLADQQRIIFTAVSSQAPRNDLILVASELSAKPIFSEVCSANLMERLAETNKILNDFGLFNSVFTEKANEFLYVKTLENWSIYLNPKNDLITDLIKLKLLLSKEISKEKRKTLEYIDLRFSKAYYK
jgi:hypothetical protein